MATPKEIVRIGDREVAISNPTKVYFPETGYTKLDLVQYYLAVADGALRGVRGRPMALKRFVDGAAGEAFFQKRAPDNRPDWIRTAELTFPSGRTADEIVLDEPAGLAWVANLGCIDLNPHPVRADDLDHPDELRVDLDPGAGRAVVADPRGGARLSRGARGRRAGRLAQDLRIAGDPHQRPDRAALDVSGGPPCRPRAGPRRRAADARRGHLEVVEGGAPRRLPRLQPERQGPDGGDRLLGPAAAGRAGLDAAVLGRGPDRRGRGLHAQDRAGAVCRDRRPGCRDRRGGRVARGAAGAEPRSTRREGEGDAPWPPNYAKQAGEPPRVQPSKARKKPAEYEPGRGEGGGPPPEVAAERAAAVAAGDPNAGLPTEWAGSRPTPTGRRKTSIPVIEIARAATKAEALEGLERWKERHPGVAALLEPADVLVDGMRGRSSLWYRVRVNLIHVPEADRPAQAELEVDYDPWAGYEWPDRAGQLERAPPQAVEGEGGRGRRVEAAGRAGGAGRAED